MGSRIGELKSGERFDLVFNIDENEYRGTITKQLRIHDFRNSAEQVPIQTKIIEVRIAEAKPAVEAETEEAEKKEETTVGIGVSTAATVDGAAADGAAADGAAATTHMNDGAARDGAATTDGAEEETGVTGGERSRIDTKQ